MIDHTTFNAECEAMGITSPADRALVIEALTFIFKGEERDAIICCLQVLESYVGEYHALLRQLWEQRPAELSETWRASLTNAGVLIQRAARALSTFIESFKNEYTREACAGDTAGFSERYNQLVDEGKNRPHGMPAIIEVFYNRPEATTVLRSHLFWLVTSRIAFALDKYDLNCPAFHAYVDLCGTLVGLAARESEADHIAQEVHDRAVKLMVALEFYTENHGELH